MASEGRLRVLLVQYRDSGAVGGSLRVGQIVARNLDPLNVEVHVAFAYGGPGPLANSVPAEFHFLRASGPSDWPAWLRARRLLVKLRPDVIHFIDAVVWLRAAWLGCGVPTLFHVHGPIYHDRLSLRTRYLWKALRGISAGHICVSRRMRDVAAREGFISDRKSWIVYNGIDVGQYTDLPDRHIARALFDMPADAFVLGTVTRLVPEKGGVDGIALLGQLPKQFRLLVCGEGPESPRLRRAAEERAPGRVHFTDFLDDTRWAYAAMDAYLFVSRNEPFGLVLAEAMAAGVPVVGLRADGGYADVEFPLVTPDTAALLQRRFPVDPFSRQPSRDLDRLADAVLRLASDPERASRQAQYARNWVAERFNAQRQAAEIERIYRQVVRTC